MDKAISDRFTLYQRNRRHLSESTITVRASVLRRIQSTCLVDLLQASSEDLWHALEQHDLCASSLHTYICHLSQFMKWTVREGLRSDDPTSDMDKPRVPKRLPRPIGETDLQRVLKSIGWRRPLRTWLLLGSYQGFRRMEIANLRYEWIDLEEEIFRIIGKRDKERIIPMHPLVTDEMRWYMWGQDLSGPVFNVHPEAVGKAIGRAMRRCGVDCTAHQLRHRFATRLYRETEDIGLVGQLLGHDSLDTTRIYAEVGTNRMRTAVGSL